MFHQIIRSFWLISGALSVPLSTVIIIVVLKVNKRLMIAIIFYYLVYSQSVLQTTK